jgi:glycosyltransferase involved in cell wall biosynthesis
VRQLSLQLPEHGWEPWVAGPQEAIIYPSLESAGVPVARLPLRRGFGRPGEDAAAMRSIGTLLRRQRFDLVHAHSAKAGVLGRIVTRAAGSPIVYSPHCFPFVGPWGWPRRTFATMIERGLGPITDAIVCVAEDERRIALEHRIAPFDRLTVVHNGVATADPALEADPELMAFAGGRPLAGCIAVLRPQKAVDVFVAAAPQILAGAPEARLAVIGNGDLLHALRAQARDLGLDSERFRFFPFRPPAARALRALDLFVLSSAWEAFPISLLEALAEGVPQVATDVGGSAEALSHGETGLLCSAGDPVALARPVITLLNDPERRATMAAASRKRHAERFRVEEMARQTAAVYVKAVAGHASSR